MKALVLALAVFVVACGVKTGPFYPAHPVPCSADPDCPAHTHCAFPEVDSRAICMPGDSSLDVPTTAGGEVSQ